MGRLPTQVHALAVDPKRPERVYAGGQSGIFVSSDAGQSWEPAQEGIQGTPITALTIDPVRPERLYAAGPDGGLFISEDAGASWRPLRA